jgi:hypothetical protein
MHYLGYRDKIWSPAVPAKKAGPRASRSPKDEKWGMNALLIQKLNGFWERVGIAILTREAWESADPKEEYIQLV